MTRKLTVIILALFAIQSFAMDIELKINGKTFTAQIEDTETGRAFCDLLPMTLDMTELNGNEKYHYLLSGLFDLSGRRLDKEPEKGVFIKNGKKVSK